MKLLIVLALVAAAIARPDDSHYDSKYDNFNVGEVLSNIRLLKSYAHCFIGDGKCTPEGAEMKTWISESAETTCSKCTEKQKVLVAQAIQGLKDKLPEEYQILNTQINPDNKYSANLDGFLKQYAS